MKKLMLVVLALALTSVAARGQSAQITSPKADESWTLNTIQTIAWTWKGAATVKLVLFNQNQGKLGFIASAVALGNGSVPWTAGALEGGKIVSAGSGYRIRIFTVPGDILLAVSPFFELKEPESGSDIVEVLDKIKIIFKPGSKAITVSRPASGETWIPLQKYTVKWSFAVSQTDTDGQCQPKYNCYGCQINAWVAPAANPDAADKVYLLKEHCTPFSYDKGVTTFAGEYTGVVPNLQSGDYVVRVARNDKPAFCGTSQPFTVNSTWSSGSGYLGPDPTQGQSDLALNDVFFDDAGNIAIKVKNMGDPYLGYIPIQYKFITIGSASMTLKDEKMNESYSLQAGEERKIILTHWGGFTFSSKGWDGGSPSQGIPSRYIPENSRPFQANVTIKPDNDINPNNNWVSKRMCMIQDADIGTDGQIRFTFSSKEWIYIASGTANQVPVEAIQWIADKAFSATLEIYLWNYGCAARTFDCWLYVDDLPGQKVASGLHLQPGQRVQWQQPVTIKVPSRCGAHKLVFIADPKEHGHEPYPNSYQNNFIPVTLKILCGGTITGSGW